MKCPECAQFLTGDACGCGWAMFPHKETEPRTKAHAAYIASGERTDGAKVDEFIGKIRKSGGGRAKVFLPGEAFPDYQREKHKAMQAGMKPEAFDKMRMELNGWTPEDESKLTNGEQNERI